MTNRHYDYSKALLSLTLFGVSVSEDSVINTY